MLKPGITGFLGVGEPTTGEQVSFADFKAAVFKAARVIRATVVQAEPADVTPNFHSAVLDAADGKTVVLCNACCPIIAFAEVPVAMGSLRFKDHAALRDAMGSFGRYTVANLADLVRPLCADDVAALGSGDVAQLRYWKTKDRGRSGVQLVRLSNGAAQPAVAADGASVAPLPLASAAERQYR